MTSSVEAGAAAPALPCPQCGAGGATALGLVPRVRMGSGREATSRLGAAPGAAAAGLHRWGRAAAAPPPPGLIGYGPPAQRPLPEVPEEGATA